MEQVPVSQSDDAIEPKPLRGETSTHTTIDDAEYIKNLGPEEELEFLKNAVGEEDEPTELNAARPELVGVMTAMSLQMIKNRPDITEPVMIYTVVSNYLREIYHSEKGGSIAPLVFVYYLEVHRAAQLFREGHAALDKDSRTVAALSIFDLYQKAMDQSIVRVMVDMSAKALQDVITKVNAHKHEHVTQTLMSNLSSLALITQTVREYTKGVYRKRNQLYIAWVGNFLKKASEDLDAAFAGEPTDVKYVLDALTNRARKILPPTCAALSEKYVIPLT
jgi:hypothetical protein